jgi:serine/threonine-protein kinase HipA
VPDRRPKVLTVLLDGRRAGIVKESAGGQLTLTYDDAYRRAPGHVPVSLSMPFASSTHGDDVVRSFMWGLLPDSERVLDRWARAYQVSARNPFGLLAHIGEDCAGAVQFVRSEREGELLAGTGGIEWIDEAEVARRLRLLRRDPAAWHASETGQFSLAGAQAKTALHFDPLRRRWGDPWGAMATTHILKPAVTGFDDHDLNEHLCLEAARGLGLPAARSWVGAFGGERAIVVERFDRRAFEGSVFRIHQEDACQALGVPPTAKYQYEGGPSPEDIIRLLRTSARSAAVAERDVHRFVDALAFNWLIAGTDAHAKNYSLLIGHRQTRLAPLHDVSSPLPYDEMYLPRLKLAMRVGSEYRLNAISGRHWRDLAAGTALDPDTVIARIHRLASLLPACFEYAASDPAVRALASDLPGRLLERVTDRVRRCQAALG